MDKSALIKYCLISDDAAETYPFKQDIYKSTVVMRHKCNNKWFALIFEMDDELCLNLKCQPELIPILKEQFSAIKPAWHMNKKHWYKVSVNQMPKDSLKELIKISFDLTNTKRKY